MSQNDTKKIIDEIMDKYDFSNPENAVFTVGVLAQLGSQNCDGNFSYKVRKKEPKLS